jgi:LuxR family maltose regulon positive regulatory protein
MAAKVIVRSRLNRGVAADSAVDLAIVCAPAGFGKTTLMLQWRDLLAAEGWRCHWLSLDEGDNDLARFMRYLLAALGISLPALEDQAANLMSGNIKPTSEAILLHIADHLARSPAPTALFVDEFETSTNPDIAGFLRRLVDLGRGRLKVAVASRSIPKLGQARLRVAGRIVEIGADDLRFDLPETRAFVSDRLATGLVAAEISELHSRTVGWAAALQLACLSLAGRNDVRSFVSRFSGQDRDLADYLAEAVLERQTPAVQDFLTATSALDIFSGSLCDAVTGMSDGADRLVELEAAGLFLRRIDTGGPEPWYSYHKLFADFLRSQLLRRYPERVAGIHRAASEWFAARGTVAEAAWHARAAGDLDRALGLIDHVAMEEIFQGRLKAILDWAEDLPYERLIHHPRLCLAYIWALSFARRYDAAGNLLQRLQGRDSPAATWPEDVRDGLLAFEALIPALGDDFATVRSRIADALRRLSLRRTFEHGVIANVAAHWHINQGEFGMAHEVLAEAKASHAEANSLFGMSYSRMLEGVALVSELHLERGIECLRSAFDDARGAVRGYSYSSSVAAGFLAEALYEINDLDGAALALDGHLQLIAESGIADVVAAAFLTMVRIRLAHGDEAGALYFLEEAEVSAHRRKFARVVNTIRWERVRLAQIAGNATEADRIAASIDETAVRRLYGGILGPVEGLRRDIAPIRLAIAQHRLDGLRTRLRSLLNEVTRNRLPRRKLKLDMLLAMVHYLEGNRPAATVSMCEALRLGLGKGVMRSYLDEGPLAFEIIGLCREPLLSSAVPSEAGLLKGRFEALMALGECGPLGVSPKDAAADEARLGHGAADGADHAAITEREIEILGILSLGLSNRDIAERLTVSETTVKWHLRNIFDKLGAANRTQAVFSARRANLI